MNTVLIVFLVLIIFISIYLAAQYFNPNHLIRQSKPLNVATGTPITIPVNMFDNPGSVRYYYEGWFFINANAPVQSQNVLFNRGNSFVVTLGGSTLNVYVNTTVNGTSKGVSSTGVLDTTGISPLVSLNNFPFQKWAQLVINVDGTTVDLYIDGKFVQTVQSSTPINVNVSDTITYGNQYTIGNITRFKRPATNINPQGVWNDYMLGSGETNSITDYHLNAQLTKDKSVRLDQRLF